MRKFSRAFLTTSAVILLLVNLVIILLYGRQFYACVDQTGDISGNFCSPSPESATPSMILLNIIVIFVFVLIWLAIRNYRHRFPTG